MTDKGKRARERIRETRERKRRRVLRRAQELARSGQHADHTTIVPLLEQMEGFEFARERFEDHDLRAQLDQLCRLAGSA
jgi:hypothetical protein